MWKADGLTGMRNGHWIVGKFRVKGTWIYRLWYKMQFKGSYVSFEECKERVRLEDKRNEELQAKQDVPETA